MSSDGQYWRNARWPRAGLAVLVCLSLAACGSEDAEVEKFSRTSPDFMIAVEACGTTISGFNELYERAASMTRGEIRPILDRLSDSGTLCSVAEDAQWANDGPEGCHALLVSMNDTLRAAETNTLGSIAFRNNPALYSGYADMFERDAGTLRLAVPAHRREVVELMRRRACVLASPERPSTPTQVVQPDIAPARPTDGQIVEPPQGSAERAAIMDALRPTATRDLGGRIEFVVIELRAANSLAFASVQPQRPGGGAIDCSQTDCASAGRMDAILQKENGQWRVVDAKLGADQRWRLRYCPQVPVGLVSGCD